MNSIHYIVLGAKTPTARQYLGQLADRGIKAENITAIDMKPSTMSYGENDVIPVFETGAYKNNLNKKSALVVLAESKTTFIDIADTHLDDDHRVLDLTGHFIDDPDAVYAPATGKLVIQPSPTARMIDQIVGRLPKSPQSMHVELLLPTSYFGKDAMDELFNQVKQFLMTDDLDNSVFDKKIAFNVLPVAGHVTDNGDSIEEHRIQTELSKLCDKIEQITVSTSVVPVFTGLSAHLTFDFGDKAPSPSEINKVMRSDTSIRLISPDSDMQYGTPAEIIGDTLINVSRVRRDARHNNVASLWAMIDHTKF